MARKRNKQESDEGREDIDYQEVSIVYNRSMIRSRRHAIFLSDRHINIGNGIITTNNFHLYNLIYKMPQEKRSLLVQPTLEQILKLNSSELESMSTEMVYLTLNVVYPSFAGPINTPKLKEEAIATIQRKINEIIRERYIKEELGFTLDVNKIKQMDKGNNSDQDINTSSEDYQYLLGIDVINFSDVQLESMVLEDLKVIAKNLGIVATEMVTKPALINLILEGQKQLMEEKQLIDRFKDNRSIEGNRLSLKTDTMDTHYRLPMIIIKKIIKMVWDSVVNLQKMYWSFEDIGDTRPIINVDISWAFSLTTICKHIFKYISLNLYKTMKKTHYTILFGDISTHLLNPFCILKPESIDTYLMIYVPGPHPLDIHMVTPQMTHLFRGITTLCCSLNIGMFSLYKLMPNVKSISFEQTTFLPKELDYQVIQLWSKLEKIKLNNGCQFSGSKLLTYSRDLNINKTVGIKDFTTMTDLQRHKLTNVTSTEFFDFRDLNNLKSLRVTNYPSPHLLFPDIFNGNIPNHQEHHPITYYENGVLLIYKQNNNSTSIPPPLSTTTIHTNLKHLAAYLSWHLIPETFKMIKKLPNLEILEDITQRSMPIKSYPDDNIIEAKVKQFNDGLEDLSPRITTVILYYPILFSITNVTETEIDVTYKETLDSYSFRYKYEQLKYGLPNKIQSYKSHRHNFQAIACQRKIDIRRYRMARNEEKAQSMLNRFLKLKNEEDKTEKKRPYLSSLCDNLRDAEKWRYQIVREISNKIGEIQNSSLGEHRIRDLNDEINKLVREKHHWEKRIIELGGQNYIATAPKLIDGDGREPLGSGYYKYYGEAKNLPGVREMLEKPDLPTTTSGKKSKYELHKQVDADYYGYRDDDDGQLQAIEAEVEIQLQTDAIAKWKEEQKLKLNVKSKRVGSITGDDNGMDIDDDQEQEAEGKKQKSKLENYLDKYK